MESGMGGTSLLDGSWPQKATKIVSTKKGGKPPFPDVVSRRPTGVGQQLTVSCPPPAQYEIYKVKTPPPFGLTQPAFTG